MSILTFLITPMDEAEVAAAVASAFESVGVLDPVAVALLGTDGVLSNGMIRRVLGGGSSSASRAVVVRAAAFVYDRVRRRCSGGFSRYRLCLRNASPVFRRILFDVMDGNFVTNLTFGLRAEERRDCLQRFLPRQGHGIHLHSP